MFVCNFVPFFCIIFALFRTGDHLLSGEIHEIMRRLICIFVSVAALSVFAGCDPVDMTAVEPAGMGMVDDVFFDVVTPFNRATELADFYFRYLEGRDNDAFVSTLNLEYFGDGVSVEVDGDDGVDVEWWGSVRLSEDGEFYVVTLDPLWMGLSLSYCVYVTDFRSYRIEYNSDENNLLTAEKGFELSLVADVSVNGHYANADMFRFLYEPLNDDLEVTVNAGADDEMVVFDLCRDGEFMYYPVSGTLYWASNGSDLNNLKIVFYGGYFEVVEVEEMSAGVK